MNRVMTAGLDRKWRNLAAGSVVRRGDRVLDVCCGTGISPSPASGPGRVTGLDFSERMLGTGAEKVRDRSSGCTAISSRSVRGRLVRCGDCGLRRSQRCRPRSGVSRGRRVLVPVDVCCLEITQPARRGFHLLPRLVRHVVPRSERRSPVARPTRTSGERPPASRPRGTGGDRRPRRVRGRYAGNARRWDRRSAYGDGSPSVGRWRPVNAIATIRSAPGLESYLERLEASARGVCHVSSRSRGRGGEETLAAGGKRLRPVLVFLAATPTGAEATESWRPERPSSSFTWRPSYTTTCSTAPRCGAAGRRPGPSTARRGESGGGLPVRPGFSELARTGDAAAVGILADARSGAGPRRGIRGARRSGPIRPSRTTWNAAR